MTAPWVIVLILSRVTFKTLLVFPYNDTSYPLTTHSTFLASLVSSCNFRPTPSPMCFSASKFGTLHQPIIGAVLWLSGQTATVHQSRIVLLIIIIIIIIIITLIERQTFLLSIQGRLVHAMLCPFHAYDCQKVENSNWGMPTERDEFLD